MNLAPIRNEQDYQNALNRLEKFLMLKKELRKVMNWKFFPYSSISMKMKLVLLLLNFQVKE